MAFITCNAAPVLEGQVTHVQVTTGCISRECRTEDQTDQSNACSTSLVWWFDWSDCFIIHNYYIDSWNKQFDGTMLSTSVGVNSQCMSAVQCGEVVVRVRHIYTAQ